MSFLFWVYSSYFVVVEAFLREHYNPFSLFHYFIYFSLNLSLFPQTETIVQMVNKCKFFSRAINKKSPNERLDAHFWGMPILLLIRVLALSLHFHPRLAYFPISRKPEKEKQTTSN